jgi:hypothetical protein
MTVFDLQNRRLVKNLAHKKPLRGLVELAKIIALHPELEPQSFVIGDVAILSLAVGSRERKVSMTEIAAYHRRPHTDDVSDRLGMPIPSDQRKKPSRQSHANDPNLHDRHSIDCRES